MSQIRIIFIVVLVFVSAQAQWSPQRFPSVWEREAWQEREIEILIKNMTLEILNDVTQKLTAADKVREVHQKSITFELGAIAAGVMERYWQMIRVYKTYADFQTLASYAYYTRTMYDQYAVIRGLYYEIRLEIKLFADIKKKHESTKPARPITPKYGFGPEMANIEPRDMANIDPRIMATMDPMMAKMIGARRIPQKWKAPEK